MNTQTLKLFVFYIFCFFILTASNACSQEEIGVQLKTVKILPNNPSIIYSGRIDNSNPNQPVFYWSGTSMQTQFSGTTLGVYLYDEKGNNYYNVFIDGKQYILKCAKGDSLYNIAANLNNDMHSLEITRRTDPTYHLSIFKGLAIDKDAKLTNPAVTNSLKFEIYGNSITSGQGILDETRKNNGAISTWDNYQAYGAITARNLNAEYRCISRSGIGLLISWYPLIMPEMYDRLNPNDSNSKWDFSKWTPDIVVINLGQNDYWLINRLNPVPGPTEIIQKYVDFVSNIRAKYPKAAIFCVLGSMNASQGNSPWPDYINNAVQKLNNDNDDKNLYSLMFPFKETEGHPTISEHKEMAERLTAFIKETLKLK